MSCRQKKLSPVRCAALYNSSTNPFIQPASHSFPHIIHAYVIMVLECCALLFKEPFVFTRPLFIAIRSKYPIPSNGQSRNWSWISIGESVPSSDSNVWSPHCRSFTRCPTVHFGAINLKRFTKLYFYFLQPAPITGWAINLLQFSGH